MNAALRLRTYAAFGTRSLARVAAYRLLIRAGLHPVQRLSANIPEHRFFRAAGQEGCALPFDARWREAAIRFDWFTQPLEGETPPDWFANPFGDHGGPLAGMAWWRIGDFGHGEIKGLWELSRMGWVPVFAAAAASGEDWAACRLNAWIGDWLRHNPPYLGPNWKCGQEASIRVMHLVAAALTLAEADRPEPGLIELVALHLKRIALTIGYALGQDNNHGTSEAAALYLGGSLLARAGHRSGRRWQKIGLRWLIDRARMLIAPDGSFSQHSVTYHRLMLDSYALAEHGRRKAGLDPWPADVTIRLAKATRWLHAMTDAQTGDAPVIGASDGARLLPFAQTGYRDFRPSVQLASALFLGSRAYPSGPADTLARCLRVSLPRKRLPPPQSQSFDQGGWHVLRTERAAMVMRYPRYRFRPGHADALHLDLTVDGANLLRDCGTYSYNSGQPDGDLSATRFHNTITFDGGDQMPRLGRFLFGAWLRAQHVVLADASRAEAQAGYVDHRGNGHVRRIALAQDAFICEDSIDGPFATAQLAFHVPDGVWRLNGDTVSGAGLSLSFSVDRPGWRIAIQDGIEARHFGLQSVLKVITLEVDGPCRIVTRGSF